MSAGTKGGGGGLEFGVVGNKSYLCDTREASGLPGMGGLI